MAKKKLATMHYAKCPECGKENMVRWPGEAGWCDAVHKKNFEFKHRSDGDKYRQ